MPNIPSNSTKSREAEYAESEDARSTGRGARGSGRDRRRAVMETRPKPGGRVNWGDIGTRCHTITSSEYMTVNTITTSKAIRGVPV